MAKLRQIKDWRPGLPDWEFPCPGCGCDHGVWTKAHPNANNCTWSFNGDVDKPTLSPSLRITYPHKEGTDICHFFVQNGQIRFLSDCTHALAGKTVEMEDLN